MKNALVAVLLLSMLACKEKEEETVRTDGFTPILKTAEDSLYHDVMEGHDIGMAKMGKISKYLKETSRIIDSIKALPQNDPEKMQLGKYEALQLQLQQADDDMNNWMVNFKADTLEGKPERKAYLESEKVKVEKVKEVILGAVGKGDSLLRR